MVKVSGISLYNLDLQYCLDVNFIFCSVGHDPTFEINSSQILVSSCKEIFVMHVVTNVD